MGAVRFVADAPPLLLKPLRKDSPEPLLRRRRVRVDDNAVGMHARLGPRIPRARLDPLLVSHDDISHPAAGAAHARLRLGEAYAVAALRIEHPCFPRMLLAVDLSHVLIPAFDKAVSRIAE